MGLKQLELKKDEKVLIRRWSLMYRNGKFGGWRGRLVVTNRRIWFEANLGFLGTSEEIFFENIVYVAPKNTLGLIPNDVFIRTKTGATFDFITIGRRRLIDIIRSHMTQT